jgi:hypothetical protein
VLGGGAARAAGPDLAQQGEIDQRRRDQAEQLHRIQLLQQQVTRLNDPASIEDQARERLGYVKPGERAYVILDPPRAKPSPRTSGPAAPVLPAAGASSPVPWWTRLWGPASR